MPQPEGEIEKDEALQALCGYWAERLDEFEKIYPTFGARGIGRNTALMAMMIDELDDAVMAAIAARRTT
jgi:hypothetical protein